jgi:4-amino-4-deoxy-L-arabinose transferase-like glycosyltransferase
MQRRLLLGILLLSVLVTPMLRELYVGDETKYSQVVREMRAGSFFVPTLEGSPFTHKPPLHFWIVDALTYPLGVYSVWPFVIPSLVAFALLLLLMQKWGGTMAAFVCGTSLLIWGSAQSARMDVGFTALLALAAILLQRFFDEGRNRDLLLAGVVTGIAILLKGPMAPVIMIALVVFESIRRRRQARGAPASAGAVTRPAEAGPPKGAYFLAVLLMAIVPLLWFIPAIAIGGEAFWQEIFHKQTVGRAVGAWVHRSPPWFYVLRSPATLFPWFFLTVVALIAAYKRNDERAKFFISWILAVIVPYSLLSSKLDVYMMAMVPPVALLIARYLDARDESNADVHGRRANLIMLAILAVIGTAGATIASRWVKGPDRALAELPQVRGLFVVLLVAAIVAIVITLRGKLIASTIATGFVPIAALVYVGLVLTPLANELASTRPLINAIEKQRIAPERIALHACPHLWVRGMPPALERAKHVPPGGLRAWTPEVVITSRKHADAIAYALPRYRKVDEFRMIGKWFDVYRR